MNDQCFGISDIGQMACQLYVVDEFDSRLLSAADSKTQDGACAIGKVLLGEPIMLVVLQAGIIYPDNSRIRLKLPG
jgi:hypothetical protein